MKYITVHSPIQLVNPAEPSQPMQEPEPEPGVCSKCREGKVLKFRDTKPISMYRWLVEYVLNDQRFTSGDDGKGDLTRILKGSRIAKAFKEYDDADPTERKGYVALEDEDWKLLDEVVEAPTLRQAPQQMFQFVPFMEAITRPADRKPNSQAQPKKRGGNGKADQPRA